MDFVYTASIHVSISYIIERWNLTKDSTTEEIENAINFYRDELDDDDFYAFPNIFDDVVTAVEDELNII